MQEQELKCVCDDNIWKKIESLSRVPFDAIANACVNGVQYWRWEYGLIRFDLNDKVFYIHEFLDNVQKRRPCTWLLFASN